jgi:hypothetical protein
MKRSLLTALLMFTASSALAQTPESPATPPASAGTAAPSASATEAPKEPSWTERVKLSARAYLRYSYELGEEARNANQFNIDRLYFQGEFSATERVRFQITLDAGATRNTTGNQVFFAETKSAFLEVKDLLMPGTYLRAGILPMAWIPYEEDLWSYRVQGPLPLDRWGYQTSADTGIAFGGTLPSKYGSFQVNVTNGEGFRFVEPGKRKELQARLSLNPLASMGGLPAGLFVTGYGSYGRYDDKDLAARDRSRVVGEVGLKAPAVTVVAAYVRARDPNAKVANRFTVSADSMAHGQGLYAFGVLDVGALTPSLNGVDLLVRYDALDPDTELENNDVNLLIAGVGYRWNKNIKSLVNYESVSYGVDVGGADTQKPAEQRLKVQTEFRF